MNDTHATPAGGQTVIEESQQCGLGLADPHSVQIERALAVDDTAAQVVEQPVLNSGPAKFQKVAGFNRQVVQFVTLFVLNRTILRDRATFTVIWGRTLVFVINWFVRFGHGSD